MFNLNLYTTCICRLFVTKIKFGHLVPFYRSPLMFSGPILWYQTFEYAIGHWLQKTSEHVFGCVLCVPGCFGLIRGSSLMDNNVARTYATKATEASHCIQYDMCKYQVKKRKKISFTSLSRLFQLI